MDTQLKPLLLIKPKGITSFFAVSQLKKVLPRKTKIGHCGTLDPMAEGLLIVLIGRAQTKLQDQFLILNKKYIATITFGVSSNTYDTDINSILEFSKNTNDLINLNVDKIKQVLDFNFKGEILQAVPPFSAVKVDGIKLYSKSFKNEEIVKLPVRKVNIYSYKILGFTNAYKLGTDNLDLFPKLTIEFEVSKGTYIRSIANELGKLLGVGGVLSSLKRTQIGQFKLENALSIDSAKEFLLNNFI